MAVDNHVQCNTTRPSKLGRKGDPRMHNAVAARIADPSISLLQALRTGGFNFPAHGGDDSALLDGDNVTLGQRKNQLSRRLRLSKQNSGIGSHEADATHDSSGGSHRTSAGEKGRCGPTADDCPSRSERPQSSSSFKCVNSGFSFSDEEPEILEDETQEEEVAKLAKFHPQYNPIYPTLRARVHAPAFPPATSSSSPSNGLTIQSPTFSTDNQCHSDPQLNSPTIASLSSTANSIGISLEQLAKYLSSCPDLLRILSRHGDSASKQELALQLFRTESKALLQKCMLLAGFTGEDAAEGAVANSQLAFKSWELEGARLEKMMRQVDVRSDSSRLPQTEPKTFTGKRNSSHSSFSLVSCHDRSFPAMPSANEPIHNHAKYPHKSSNHEHHHHHGQHAIPQQDKSQHSTKVAVIKENTYEERPKKCFRGKHVHKLSGECGHKPVIHKPEGGKMHIDFLLDGYIECYEGNKGQALWPSRKKCADVGCASEKVDHSSPVHNDHLSCMLESLPVCTKPQCDDECGYDPPIEIPLSEINLDSDEWNLDYFKDTGCDQTLMGLIQLGGTTEF